MKPRRPPTIRYTSPATHGAPMPGTIIMGGGPRVRRAYRVLSSVRAKAPPQLGCATWRISVEPMSATAGRDEIKGGAPWWDIIWNKRHRKRNIR